MSRGRVPDDILNLHYPWTIIHYGNMSCRGFKRGIQNKDNLLWLEINIQEEN